MRRRHMRVIGSAHAFVDVIHRLSGAEFVELVYEYHVHVDKLPEFLPLFEQSGIYDAAVIPCAAVVRALLKSSKSFSLSIGIS